MESFAMLLGHLVGDFIAQDDWQASNKANPWPGPRPGRVRLPDGSPVVPIDLADQLAAWDFRTRRWWVGNLACTIHCVLYAVCCYVFCITWMPWWAAVIVGLVHWPIDRFRLPRLFMERVSNQRAFATGPLAPWSVVVVDQVWHLLTLYLVWLACR